MGVGSRVLREHGQSTVGAGSRLLRVQKAHVQYGGAEY